MRISVARRPRADGATLAAWREGPWAAEAQAGDPGLFGLPDEPFTMDSRQWLDLARARVREERAGLIVVKDGPRWWRTHPDLDPASGEEPGSTIDAADILRLWTDPQPLTRLLELEPAGEQAGRLRVTATARGDNGYAGELEPLGWGASRWELLVDLARGMLLRTIAFAGETPVRRVEAPELAVDEPLDDALFAPLT